METNYKFYKLADGSYNISGAPQNDPRVKEVTLEEYKAGNAARATQYNQANLDMYKTQLASGGWEADVIQKAEQGQAVKSGSVGADGNWSDQKSLDQQATTNAQIANGSLVPTKLEGGGTGYVPKNGYTGEVSPSGPSPTSNTSVPATPQNATGTPVSTYDGVSVVDYLNSLGQNSSLGSRAQLAQSLGIQNYTGTSGQNTQMLNALRAQAGTQTNAASQTVSANPNTSQNGTSATGEKTSLDQPQQSELDRTIEVYTQIYNKLGLGDIKVQAQKYQDDIKNLQEKQNDDVRDVNNNPWLSEAMRVKASNNVVEKYKGQLDTLVNLEKLYSSLFDKGMTEVTSIAGHVETNMAKTLELAQKQQDAASALAKDNQVISVNGRELLINKANGKVVADLGASKTSSNGPTQTSSDTRSLENSRGPDDFADPTVYLNIYNDWIAKGGSRASFLKKYPPEDYVNPNNKWLPLYLMPTFSA